MNYTIGLISLGCAKNLVNSEQMLYLLREAGFAISGDTENVDAVVVNTCGFIESAKMEAIETILELGQAKKAGKLKKIIVAGCLSERYKDEMLKELPEVDVIIGTGSYGEIVSAVKSALEGGRASWFSDINIPDPEVPRVVTTSEDWEYIKIAEGCDNRCAYCVIPDLRGKFRSRPMENIIAEAEALARQGTKELIVIAQDITRYGTDIYGRRTLSELLRKLVAVDGIEWIRLHYLYPDEIDEELIDVIAEHDKILKYLDIPIQHISDGILKKMCRRGTGGEIRALFKRLRERIPGLVLRTSLITGLPGEGEEEFEELCVFLREARIERAGVFPYSPEEGTPAAGMDRPDSETASRRAELIMELQAGIMDEFNEARIGSRVKVLVEGYNGEYHWGRSYAESPEIDGVIWFTGGAPEEKGFTDVVITGTMDGDLAGKKALNT